jgi:hypothetical protein
MTAELHDLVFISYSSKDRKIADAVVAGLEQRKLRCWVAPRDIDPGQEWAEAIISGIKRSTTMVVVFSGSANDSKQVLREVERAINHGITVIPFRIEDIAPSGAMEYFLTVPHWLDAMSEPLEQSIERLYAALSSAGDASVPTPPAPIEPQPSRAAFSVKIVAVIASLAVLGAGAWLVVREDLSAPVMQPAQSVANEPVSGSATPSALPSTSSSTSPGPVVAAVERAQQLQALLAEYQDGLAASATQNIDAVMRLREQLPNQAIDLRVWLDPRRESFVGGERFSIKVSVSVDSYVAVFVHSSDGATVLLYPNKFDDGARVVRDQVLTIGDGGGSFELEVQPPWGIDVIHGIASTDRDAMVALLESATPIEGTPYRLVDKTTLARGIGVKGVGVVAGKAGANTPGDVSAQWGDAVHGIYTQAVK